MIWNLVFILLPLLNQGDEALKFCLVSQTILQCLYPFLHVFLLRILETIKMILNFFLHIFERNAQRIMAPIRVVC